MVDVVLFIIFILGPGIYLLFYGRSLLKRGRGGKMSRNGRIAVAAGIGWLFITAPPFFFFLYEQLWLAYYPEQILLFLLVVVLLIWLVWIIFRGADWNNISTKLKSVLGIPDTGASKSRSEQSESNVIIPLHRILDQSFDDEELRTLCAYLSVDYDNLRGQGKSAKARELILHLKRRNKVHRLIEVGVDIRPDIEWRNAFR